jgi:hypothetical protein
MFPTVILLAEIFDPQYAPCVTGSHGRLPQHSWSVGIARTFASGMSFAALITSSRPDWRYEPYAHPVASSSDTARIWRKQ